MRREKARMDAAGLQVLLVGMGTLEESDRFRRRFQVPFPLVCDSHQDLYRALAIPRGHANQVLGPTMMVRGLGAMLRGNLAGKPVGDVMQMTGTVGVGTTGEVWYVHTGTSAADYATVDQILAAWRAASEDC